MFSLQIKGKEQIDILLEKASIDLKPNAITAKEIKAKYRKTGTRVHLYCYFSI